CTIRITDAHYCFVSLTSCNPTGYNICSHVTDGSGFTTWSMTVNADRLGECAGLAGFCFCMDYFIIT
ncbi:MAG: hypothetical protein IJV46_01005, partial [Acidaminococcaceae bacterium]|nr:hypothetical protein [Acidaminococcaceae bacterium]